MQDIDIHNLIDKYFDGTLSDEEESVLRGMLLSGNYAGEDVDEALAVMGYWAVRRRNHVGDRRRHASWAAAACTAVAIFIGGWAVYGLHHDSAPESVAYINGIEYVGDRATDLMDSQLLMMSVAAGAVEESINDDLSVFAGLVD